MRQVRQRRATIAEILEYILQNGGIIDRTYLCDRFGYTPGGANYKLQQLKRKRLLVNDQRGEWAITQVGINRIYYERQKKKGSL